MMDELWNCFEYFFFILWIDVVVRESEIVV